MNGFAHNGETAVRQVALKLVMVGESGSGKTSICERHYKGMFSENKLSTVGAAFHSKTLDMGGCRVRVNVWDTGGQEKYRCMAPMYYREAQGAVLVYDITRRESFDKAMMWMEELRRNTRITPVMILAGNKADLEHARTVPQEEAKLFAERNDMHFMETSAKTGSSIAELFQKLAVEAFKILDKFPGNHNRPRSEGFPVNSELSPKNRLRCCNS